MVKYKVYISAGFTEKSRFKKLEKVKLKWEEAGWTVLETIHSGMSKPTFLIIEGDENCKVLKWFNVVEIKEPTEEEALRKAKLDKILLQIKSLGEVDTFGTKKEIKSLVDVLSSNEDVLGHASGIMDGSTWLMVCTPIRVILLDRGMLFGVKQKDFLLENISSIDFELRLIYGEINITVSSAKMKIEKVLVNSVKKFVEAVKLAQLNKKAQQGINTSSSEPDDNLINKLKELSELKGAGILNDDEFQKAKNKLLV